MDLDEPTKTFELVSPSSLGPFYGFIFFSFSLISANNQHGQKKKIKVENDKIIVYKQHYCDVIQMFRIWS